MDQKVELMIALLEAHRDRLDSIDENLAEHMRRTDVLEQLHIDNQTRIEALEKPVEARRYLMDAALAIGKLAGAVISVLAVLKLLGKF